MTPEDPNHPNYFPEAKQRPSVGCQQEPCSNSSDLDRKYQEGFANAPAEIPEDGWCPPCPSCGGVMKPWDAWLVTEPNVRGAGGTCQRAQGASYESSGERPRASDCGSENKSMKTKNKLTASAGRMARLVSLLNFESPNDHE
jgi:hypothetical protein